MNHIDIEDASLFVQQEVSKLAAAYRATNWHKDTVDNWCGEGYLSLMSFCLEDSPHPLAFKKQAISHVRRLQIAALHRFEDFIETNHNEQSGGLDDDWEEEEGEDPESALEDLRKDNDATVFVEKCRVQVAHIQKLNAQLFAPPVSTPPRRKLR